MADLPDFPVHDFALAAVLHGLAGAYEVDDEGNRVLVPHEGQGGDFSFQHVLDFYSGYDPAELVPFTDEDGHPHDVMEYPHPTYHYSDVIRSLISEVRRQRVLVVDAKQRAEKVLERLLPYPLPTDITDPQMAADIRTLMAKLMGPKYPSDAKAEGAWRRVYDALPPLVPAAARICFQSVEGQPCRNERPCPDHPECEHPSTTVITGTVNVTSTVCTECDEVIADG